MKALLRILKKVKIAKMELLLCCATPLIYCFLIRTIAHNKCFITIGIIEYFV